MLTEFNRTYKESFQYTCSPFIFVIVGWVFAITIIIAIVVVKGSCAIARLLLLLRYGIIANIISELAKSSKVSADLSIILKSRKNIFEVRKIIKKFYIAD
jgi:hypothetical protein